MARGGCGFSSRRDLLVEALGEVILSCAAWAEGNAGARKHIVHMRQGLLCPGL